VTGTDIDFAKDAYFFRRPVILGRCTGEDAGKQAKGADFQAGVRGMWATGPRRAGKQAKRADFRVVLRGNKATCGGWGLVVVVVGHRWLAFPVLEPSLPSLGCPTHVKGTGMSKSPWYPLYIP
jgi:hypothetical protein